jgi:uncharacterized protein (DUF169 family)
MKMNQKEYENFYARLGLKEHPLVVFYSNQEPESGITSKEKGHECIFTLLKKARHNGETVYFDKNHIGCPGGAYFLGFRPTRQPKIEYFLSCGIPGEMEGERYIKSPELAKEFIAASPPMRTKGEYCIFKALDKLTPSEEPEIIIFFAPPDILSGLVGLTGFASGRLEPFRSPFSSGCGSIVYLPLEEAEKENPQAILGLFDVSARPFVEAHVLTLAMPTKMFSLLLADQDKSFLITESWKKVRERIAKS